MADIGLIGTGALAAGIAKCLLTRGHCVLTATPHGHPDADPPLTGSAIEHLTYGSLIDRCETIITCSLDATANPPLPERIIARLSADQLWIDMATADPAHAKELAKRAEHGGGIYADAPVIGSPQLAERGELTSLVGCRREKFNRIKHVVGAYSTTVQRFGDPGAGLTAKLLNDFVAEGTALLLAEAFRTARRSDLDWRALHEVMSAGPANSAMLEQLIATTLDGSTDTYQLSAAEARNDIDNYRRLSRQHNARSSNLADAVFETLDTACRAGYGERRLARLLEQSANDDRDAVQRKGT